MSKTAIYCRVSTENQSTDRQEEDLLNYAKSRHIEIDSQHIYVDIISGFSKTEDRPQYQELKEEIEKGNIDKILFWEMTRLGRNTTELLKEIENLKEKNVEMYFHKQSLTVSNDRKKANGLDCIGTELLIFILAVISKYEVELFAQRGLSGKIEKVEHGGGDSDSRALGYSNDESKKIQINQNEALLVKRIFSLYSNGKSVNDICDILNSEGIPTKSKDLAIWFETNRTNKKLPKKDYTRLKNAKWRCSTISRMLKNELYIGHRHIDYYEPDPTNEEHRPKKRKDRTLYHTIDTKCEYLRIIDEETWQKVQERLAVAPYNKNNAIKHENLLKDKMICGECGSHFTVGLAHDTATRYDSPTKTYRCYGLIKRVDKPKTCDCGMQTRQARLDGLVMELSMLLFAKKNYMENACQRRKELTEKMNEVQNDINVKQQILQQTNADYESDVRKLINDKISKDDIIITIIQQRQTDYHLKVQGLTKGINKLKKEIVKLNKAIESIDIISNKREMMSKLPNLEKDPNALKSLVDDFIDSITSYRIHKLWNLIIVKYKTGEEMWGTMKTARYKNEEIKEFAVCGTPISKASDDKVIDNKDEDEKEGVLTIPMFYCWKIDNSSHSLSYDNNTKLIHFNGMPINAPSIRLKKGDYSYEQFDAILKDDKIHSKHSYRLYDYEAELERVEKEKELKEQQENSENEASV